MNRKKPTTPTYAVKWSWFCLPDAEGRIAAEGALPYPPGVLCVVPGEIWGGAVLRYFSALEEGINLLPGFAPELQGVYIEEHDGRNKFGAMSSSLVDAQSTLLKGENYESGEIEQNGCRSVNHTDDGQHDGLRYHHAADKACRSRDNLTISWLVTAVGSMALAWAFAKCGMFSRKSGRYGRLCRVCFR